MANVIKGKLVWKGEGKERKRLLCWQNKKGEMTMPNRFPTDQLAVELRDRPENEIDVELELENGQPYRIRREGTTWIEPTPTQQPQGASRNKGARGANQTTRRPNASHSQSSQTHAMNTPNKPRAFHNPYNFIPAPPRDNPKVKQSGLGDESPVGHDRYVSDRYTGRLRIRMTVVTPLLLPDTARVQISGHDQDEHKTYPVRVDEKGNPHINPTAVKGMIRSAYEAITNSRLSIFAKHDTRLAFRGKAETPIPARIERRGNKLGIRLMDYGIIGKAAKLERYKKNSRDQDRGERKTAQLYEGTHTLPQHGDRVWVDIIKHKAGFEVKRIIQRKADETKFGDWKAGWVCVTGANISGKRFERVFLESDQDKFIPITDDYAKRWKELVANYQKIHEEDLEKREKKGSKPTDYLGDEPGKTAWSRHIFTKNAQELTEGTLCYALTDDNGVIKALLPVMISRRLYDISPADLLPKELHPAKELKELSPADRVFGWVNQAGKGAYRGQLRVGVVDYVAPQNDSGFDPIQDFSPKGLPLAILGQPKPQQARFYVAANTSGEAQKDGLTTEEVGYNKGKGLRGRKVYPHHRLTLKPDGASYEDRSKPYWKPQQEDRMDPLNGGKIKLYQEYRRWSTQDVQARDNQNRSMLGWIKPDATFEFDLHVTNLSAIEIGALIWLLDLPGNCYHRFGGGKPLGFGSVRLEIVRDQSDICTGAEMTDRLKSLEDVSFEFNFDATVNTYKRAICKAYGESRTVSDNNLDEAFKRIPFIDAFLNGAMGFEDELPIHYPRTTKAPNPEGESFKWFVENAATARSRAKHGYALRDLADDEGLPILESH